MTHDPEHSCDFGCGADSTHWCDEWDGCLCDPCCEAQNVRDGEQVLPCDYLAERRWDIDRCHSCGEQFRDGDERAEIMRGVMPMRRMLVHQPCMQEGDRLA